ncbi:uncharacterized protein EAE97_008851 [Botrytis byssoidea]|uniref:Uncharacterized protein n=1 Tax=Botrytis byssoidea TaxID=139641 RepID=A0A9P5IC08_9HELO|nr:uncharacterized protein EAE97_008851 [Botrytis byssoidea]KAF7933084.1 hypothetical protein EAE97_008851 [Botrytis byssoidea]
MAEQPSSSLNEIQALHSDLLALSNSRLSNLDRLAIELEAHITAFRNLLNQKNRNEQSRQTITKEILERDGQKYKMNEDFQQGTFQLADELNLDEIEASQIFFDAQDDADATGRSVLSCSIIRFHQRRKLLLDCLRLTLQQVAELEGNSEQEQELKIFLEHIIKETITPTTATTINTTRNVPTFISKCISAMGDIRQWLQKISDKVSSASVLGQPSHPELLEIMEYQRHSLIKQHELLGVIILYLVKADRSSVEDFELLLGVLKKADKYDNILVHHFPALAAYIWRFGSPEGGSTIQDARALDKKINVKNDQNAWVLPYAHAAFRAWWLAEYSGWYVEHHDGLPHGINLEEEAKQRSQQFNEALKDGAFDFLLSLSADVKAASWTEPSRQGFRLWLQRKAPQLLSDSVSFSDFFEDQFMEQLQTFIESFITNLPDVLRKLRIDEDEQRQLSHEHEHDLDLERFIIVISYAFDGRPKAALDGFWDVPDGVLIGFMYWASRRASTPLVSAFCEMLQAISGDDECATAAHEFLLDESPQAGKMKRAHALTWNQIFKELTFFTNKLRDQPVPQAQAYRHGKPNHDQAELEPESYIMLESYLRLISQLCSHSAVARQFLMQHPSYQLTDLLFQLASSSIPSRFRAGAFTALRSLLSNKTKAAAEYLWTALDIWVSGGYVHNPSAQRNTAPPSYAPDAILRKFGTGFEEPDAFILLLHALVLPYEEDSALRDGLPFPELLGTSNRMPGIDPYVDFAVGQVFGSKMSEIMDPIQLRLLQLTCLTFITTCLETFNEDLVIFANRSNISVDTAIKTSDLQTYVLLHPFSRVMEWMYNSSVMDAIFAAIHQDVNEVASAAPDSPSIMCLLQGIRAVTLIMDLQPTYRDIVRPLIKHQASHRRSPVPNTAYASFEDGVLNHLSIIPDLGLYCSSGNPELVIASLKLLEKLSASPRLAPAPKTGSRRIDRNKAIAALEENNAAEAISRALLQETEANIDETQGQTSDSYIIKVQILDFLIACLEACPGQTTIAHLLLGFQCRDDHLEVDMDSLFSRRISLFHSILRLANDISLEDEGNISSWLVSLRYKCLRLLKHLWHSPISSSLVMIEMRANNSFFEMFIRQTLITPGLLWDGRDLADPEFLDATSASCLSNFLNQRANVLQYTSAELRQIALSHLPSLKERMFNTLLGSTIVEEGQQVDNCSVFDLFDFMDIPLNQSIALGSLSWFKDIDVSACEEVHTDCPPLFNMMKLEELLTLRRSELAALKRLENPQDVVAFNNEAQMMFNYYFIDNKLKELRAARHKALQSWVQLLLVMVETMSYDEPTKIVFVLQTLQIILPRLENCLENAADALELAKLTKALLFSLNLDSNTFKEGDLGQNLSDKLFHVFELSLRAINAVGANGSLKEIFYSISYRYLTGTSETEIPATSEADSLNGDTYRAGRSNQAPAPALIPGLRKPHSTQTVKLAGDRLIDIICDDALVGEHNCRIAALLLLGALVKMAKQENSNYIIESLNRLNFISILVNSIGDLARSLQETSREDSTILLSDFYARLALLVHISQTRSGATAVLNSGLFHAILASGLFALDTDLEIDFEDSEAVSRHYSLLAAIMRVICCALVSRGLQNEQSLDQGRRFLADNRAAILAVLKKSAGLGTGNGSAEQSIVDISDSFMLLMTITRFVDFEETIIQKRPTLRSFT